MTDRVSKYPGRVKLVPVDGQANVYDLTLADEPTAEGTPLNKASLLTDATAALYGKTSAATPNDILAAIKPLITSTQTVAEGRAKIQTGSYVGTGTYGASNPCSLTFDFVPKMIVIKSGPYGSYINLAIMLHATPYAPVCSVSYLGSQTVAYGNAIYLTFSGSSVSWYNTNAAQYQLNGQNSPSWYFAIG